MLPVVMQQMTMIQNDSKKKMLELHSYNTL